MEVANYIIYLYNFLLGIGAVLAFIMIIYAGINISRSGGNTTKISEGKKQIINSLIGLAVLLTSYILLTTINPNIISFQNLTLGGTTTIDTNVSSVPGVEKIINYTFEEIPLGTITEGVLMGTSSTKNDLPCLEYEEKNLTDANGRIIIGDAIDQNKDGKINSKDYLLNKDIFYCIKSLNKAVKNKTEIHLKNLINQLDALLQSNCSCKNCYDANLLSEPWQCSVTNLVPCVPYNGRKCDNYNPKPAKCSTAVYFCGCCGDYTNGCKDAPGWSETSKVNKSCNNPEVIDCKRQEIKQLVDGSKPDDYCYANGYLTGGTAGNSNKEEIEQKMLTFQKAMQRMDYFKQYYIKEVDELKKAEAKMKDPAGERLSIAELQNNVETRNNVSVSKTTFDGYDVNRYCREANCVDYEKDDLNPQLYKYDQSGQRICKKYELNKDNRACKMEKDDQGNYIAEKEYYTYSGDGATFYYSAAYNEAYKEENQLTDKSDNKCDISEQKLNKEMYGGLIPIGETVDSTEDWGLEAARLIQEMIGEVNGIANTAVAIADFPTQCQCSGNCKQEIPISACVCPCDGEDCCPDESCQSNECSNCEATELQCPTAYMKYFTGCLECYKPFKPIYSYKPISRPDYYVCPFKNMCNLVRTIYQVGQIDNSCFSASASDAEEAAKETMKKQIGYLVRFEVREKMLFELSGMAIDNGSFTAGAAALFPELDCLGGCDTVTPGYLSCSSSSSQSVQNRFTLLGMLKTSRERLTGCVKGYSYPQKTTADNVRILSCYEAENSNLVILPEFPYPNKAKATPPYINCYPYNSSKLTDKQKETCFYNINRTGVESNPGCLMITKEYMDNYYCCQ